jgi:hypothetical protein
MLLIIPLVVGAIGAAVGAVAGAFVSHAIGEKDRQAAKHHRQVANELNNQYTELKTRYQELTERSQQQIFDLTQQRALDAVEKDGLRLALRLQQSLILLMTAIDREPTILALNSFRSAVYSTNEILDQLGEELIAIPRDYVARNLIKAARLATRQNGILSIDNSSDGRENSQNEETEEKKMNQAFKNMSTEDFQIIHHRIHETGTLLLQYLQELRSSRLKEGNETKGLQSVEDNLAKALTALEKQRYRVAVIAAMKAGKSTFLNALIGADVLASETEACTFCQTYIRSVNSGQTPKLLEYRDGQKHGILIAEGNALEIKQKFLERTREVRMTDNGDRVIRFELEHPIAAISQLSALAGLTLVDTPGPNEWQSSSSDLHPVALKQIALEALRTCEAVLFILDYTAVKNDINLELFQDLIKNRQELLQLNTGKIYFILNKVDRKTEGDPPIDEVIEHLQSTLIKIGIPAPVIYPVSAWQGLLAKLIQEDIATDKHLKDFKNFFSAKYSYENQDGSLVIPPPKIITPQALIDSNIPLVEQSAIQTVVQNAGWNLLSDVLKELIKTAKVLEETLRVEIRGWEIEIGQLEQKIAEYNQHSELVREKVREVKKSIELQKQVLTEEFILGINQFATDAKARIQTEIDRVAQTRNQEKKSSLTTGKKNPLESLSDFLGALFELPISSEPYKLKVKKEKNAVKVGKKINEYCAPIIHGFWIDTEDKLIAEGEIMRVELVRIIQQDIQTISDELSSYLGETLQVKIESNKIQFPKFEFDGIDTKVQKQQEVVTRKDKEKRVKSRPCNSDEVYYEDVIYTEKVSYYEIDLAQICQGIQQKIDDQVSRIIDVLQRVVRKQVDEDFKKAENQISDYIDRFKAEFDQLLTERAVREVAASEIIADLESQRNKSIEYLNELVAIESDLGIWQPRNVSSRT